MYNNYQIHVHNDIDYCIECATYGFYVQVAKVWKSEFSTVLQQVNKNPYKALSMQ